MISISSLLLSRAARNVLYYSPHEEQWSYEKGLNMATLSMFYGIIIKMNKEDREPHHKPHVHGWHAGQQASFDIETGEVLAGVMPPDDVAMVRA